MDKIISTEMAIDNILLFTFIVLVLSKLVHINEILLIVYMHCVNVIIAFSCSIVSAYIIFFTSSIRIMS